MRKIDAGTTYINFLFCRLFCIYFFIFCIKKSVLSLLCRRSISFLTFAAYLNLTLSPCFADYSVFREGENPHSYKIKLRRISQDMDEDKLCVKVTGKWESSEPKKHTVTKEFPYISNNMRNHESHEVAFFPGLGTLHISTNGELSLLGEGQQKNLSSLMISTFTKISFENLSLDTLEVKAPTVYLNRYNKSKFLKIISDGIVINENIINSEYFTIESPKFINKLKVETSKAINLKLQELDNTGGKLHAGTKINIHCNDVQNNKDGHISGLKGTKLTIGKTFSNQNGSVGLLSKSSPTYLNIPHSFTVTQLGDVAGGTVSIAAPYPDSNLFNFWNRFDFSNGRISAKKTIFVKTPTLFGKRVVFNSPELYLDVGSFLLDDQTECDRTRVARDTGKNFTLPHPYRTKGSFEIWQKDLTEQTTVVKAFKKRVKTGNYAHTHTFDIQANLQADKGILINAPSAKLRIGDSTKQFIPKVLLPKAKFLAYLSLFDLEQGTLSAKNAEIHALLGVKIGRLIQDPTQEVFSTIFAHSQCNLTHHLGNYITNATYTIIDGKQTNIYDHKSIYDDRHLFRLPVFIPNPAVFLANGKIYCEGPLHHQGSLLEAKELVINSPLDSFCKSSEIKIKGDLSLTGGGDFILDRVIGDLEFKYYHYLNPNTGCPFNNLAYTFVNSGASACRVEGKIKSYSQGSIINKGSILHASGISPGILGAPQNIETNLYQRFMQGTIEQRNNIASSYATSISSNIIGGVSDIKVNNIGNGGIAWDDDNRGYNRPREYVYGFLSNTNNFEHAQRVFRAETSTDTEVVLSADNMYLQGLISMPSMLISVGKGGLVLGSPNPYYIEKQDPICRLLDKGFNLQTTYVTPALKDLIEKARNTPLYKPFFQPFFKFQELYFFNKKSANAFYQEIQEHVNFLSPDGVFTKPEDVATVFSLSPNLLIGRVQEQCQKALGRGYIYDNCPINDKFVQKLHRNTTKYLQKNGLTGKGLEQALIGNNPRLPSSSKPLIYYIQSINEQNVQELEPYLFLPPSMIEEARGSGGDHINIRFLGIFPEGMQPHQLIAYFKNNTSVQNFLIKYFESDPRTIQYLTNQEIEPSSLTQEGTLSSPGRVTINASISTDKMFVLSPGTLKICGSIEARDAFLSSLFSDVHIQSLVERVYTGNLQNYRDHILKARVAAKEILEIIAKGNVIFEGAETYSGALTHIEALGKIFDIPVTIVTQRLKNFCGDTQGTERVTSFFQKCSSHISDGTIDWLAQNGLELYAPILAAKKFRIKTKGSIEAHEVHDREEHETEFHRKGGCFQGDKHHHEVKSSSRSKGMQVTAEEMEVESKGQEVILTNPTLAIGKGFIHALLATVHINLGTNHYARNKSTQSSSPWWQSSQQDSAEHFTYSNPLITSPIEIFSKEAILQSVRGQAPSYLEKIKQQGGEIVQEILDEYHYHDTKKIQGPGIALSSLITLIVAIGTQGTGASIAQTLFSVSGPSQMAMWNAGVTAVCQKAAISLVSNQGNIKGVFEDLTSTEFLKSFVTTVCTAGLSDGMIDKCGLSKNSKGFLDRFKVAALKASIRTTFASTLYGDDFAKTLRDGIIQAGVDSLGGVLANHIAAALPHREEIMDITIHKLLHGVLGAGLGAITNEDRKSGAFSGALGAIVAETVAEIITDSPSCIEEKIRLQAEKEGEDLTSQQLKERCKVYLEGIEYQEYLTTRKNISLVAAASAALLVGADVNIATDGAYNALENNFLSSNGKTADEDEVMDVENAGTNDESADTDDEADKTYIGRKHNEILHPIKEQFSQIGKNIQETYQAGEAAYISKRLAIEEKYAGRPLNYGEITLYKAQCSREFQLVKSYMEPGLLDEPVKLLLQGVGTILDLPLTGIEYALRAGGVPKGLARALHNVADDALCLTGVGGVLKGFAKKGVKVTGQKPLRAKTKDKTKTKNNTNKTNEEISDQSNKRSLEDKNKLEQANAKRPKTDVINATSSCSTTSTIFIHSDVPTQKISVQETINNPLRIIQDLDPRNWDSAIFDKIITWTAPKGTQQTYKIFQRNDINWDMIRTSGDKRFVGKTNADAARAGLAPQLNNGYFATLHHIGQDSRGALVEASRQFHGVDSPYHKILHNQFGKNKPNPFYPVDHDIFRKESAAYWKMRVK